MGFMNVNILFSFGSNRICWSFATKPFMFPLFNLQMDVCLHSLNAIFLLGDASLNCMVIFFLVLFLLILFLLTYLLQTYIYFLTHAEISSVSICIFYFVDGFICDFSVDHSCLCFIMVKASNPFSDCCFPLDTILFIIFLSVVPGGLILSLTCHPHTPPYGTFINSMHNHHSNSIRKIKK